jgi:hypothetical protein
MSDESLVNKLQNVIEDECPVWEQQFDAGPGVVCSTNDAATVVAKWLSGTACVRLDGLADKIAEWIHEARNKPDNAWSDERFAESLLSLLQSLAVQ